MLNDNAILAYNTILQRPTAGIATCFLNIMEHSVIDRLAGMPVGSYKKNPEDVYIAMQKAIGVSLLDQYIPDNPLSMGDNGYEVTEYATNTGTTSIYMDGLPINSPEDVCCHIENIAIPRLYESIGSFNEKQRITDIISTEDYISKKLGPSILKTGYGFIGFPAFSYGDYGYVNYFSAYALYPDIIEKYFSVQADYWLLNNKAVLKAYKKAGFAPYYRLDHDMADSRGTLTSIKSLENIWLPYFSKALDPIFKSDIKAIWHCDGNLSQLIPILLEAGVKGFQGFQYEDGMDYEKICKMKTRDGEDLLIIAGVSVTRTLPMGKPSDVVDELKFLVENGPKNGLILGASSSIAPGTPWENISVLVDGLNYYRIHGR